MIAELVELGKRIRKGHDALKEEKCSWYIVINKYGTFLGLTPCDVTIEAEKLPAKKGRARLLLDKPEETLGFKGSKDKYEKYLAKSIKKFKNSLLFFLFTINLKRLKRP